MAYASLVRYWGSKPQLLIKALVDGLDSDVIVDPFGGSGAIARAVVETGRQAIYLDLNPYAWLAAHVSLAAASRREYDECVRDVVESLDSVRVERKLLRRDYLAYSDGTPFWKRRQKLRVSEFFGYDARLKLFKLLKAIDAVDASIDTKLALYLTFCAALYKSSLMCRREGGSWPVPCYWISRNPRPKDPLEAFIESAERFSSYFAKARRLKVVYSLRELERGDVALLLGNALTAEYRGDWALLTDPPFFDEIQYMELSFFYWAWLRESELPRVMRRLTGRRRLWDMGSEIVVNPARGATLSEYLEKMRRFAKKTSRMKEKILIFHEEDEKLVEQLASILRSEWKTLTERRVVVDKQRSVGPRGSREYIVFISTR